MWEPFRPPRLSGPIMSGNPIMEDLDECKSRVPGGRGSGSCSAGAPEVADAWEEPSALAEMTVSALTGRLAYQIFSVGPALDEPASEAALTALAVSCPTCSREDSH